MMLRSVARHAVIAAVGLAALAACGTAAVPPAALPAAASAASPLFAQEQAPDQTQQQLGQIIATEAPAIARTQGRVKIYTGASTSAITPPTDHASNTIQLQVIASAQIGPYVSDSSGMTLYRFDKDTAKPSKSNCTGDCAETWPPLLVKSPGDIYSIGLDAKTVGYVERPDGTCQVTLGGWPLYYFSKDQQPGDIKGQGVGNTWFAVNPKGGKTSATQQPASGGAQQGSGSAPSGSDSGQQQYSGGSGS
jgi:predicted lipoprotein with Yx(FWY)xxD motif